MNLKDGRQSTKFESLVAHNPLATSDARNTGPCGEVSEAEVGARRIDLIREGLWRPRLTLDEASSLHNHKGSSLSKPALDSNNWNVHRSRNNWIQFFFP